MGDSSFITVLSIVPLLVLVLSAAGLALVWRMTRRPVQRAVAFLLIVVGMFFILSAIGSLLSMAAGALIAAMGFVLLIVGQRAKIAP
jgi:energy-converting hydrogenase Eha subunit C